ncbi:MAG: hypothetical protein A2096_04770 [Spirochaetes bacterium GWF1_41_5]|nr:MAG: hypothetical protein A2096_04770 [Spirochaetes bacterium GWF1_41_5]HBE03003.1 hypothetical protein [Spirochaetia bacterium]
MNPPVSIIMPVYNCGQYLTAAIESILKQKFTDFELLIIYDRSSDASDEIIDKYHKQDSRLRIHENRGLGIISALNCGLDLAAGEFIARMDADDISLPERINSQYNLMKKNPECILCGTWYKYINEEDKVLSEIPLPEHDSEIKTLLAVSAVFAHGSVMFRRSALGNLRYSEAKPNFAEDYRLWTELAFRGRLAVIPEYLYHYREYSASLSQRVSRELASDTAAAGMEYLSKNREFIFSVLPQLLSRENLSLKSKKQKKYFFSLVQQLGIKLVLAEYLKPGWYVFFCSLRSGQARPLFMLKYLFSLAALLLHAPGVYENIEKKLIKFKKIFFVCIRHNSGSGV